MGEEAVVWKNLNDLPKFSRMEVAEAVFRYGLVRLWTWSFKAIA